MGALMPDFAAQCTHSIREKSWQRGEAQPGRMAVRGQRP